MLYNHIVFLPGLRQMAIAHAGRIIKTATNFNEHFQRSGNVVERLRTYYNSTQGISR